MDGDGYPLYCTLNDIGHGHGHLVDNRNVVLYNPFLFWKYGRQINIEVCALICAIRYIHLNIFTKDMIVQLCNLVVNQMRLSNTLMQDMLVLLKHIGIYLQ
jgi:hypothetical protein